MGKETMKKILKDSISDVLGTMFFLPVQMTSDDCIPEKWFSDKDPLFEATIHFGGPHAGSFHLIMPIEVASEITANFLGLNESEINVEQRRDTVKEAINMIGGHALSVFDHKGRYKLGLPRLTEKKGLADIPLSDLNGEVLLMETEDNRLGIIFEMAL